MNVLRRAETDHVGHLVDADHRADDPTIRKCIHYARREGCGGILVCNVFAWRATDKRELVAARKRGDDPVGEHNEAAISWCAAPGTLGVKVVAGWGLLPSKRLAAPALNAKTTLLSRRGRYLLSLGANADGSPKHPLYLSNDAPLVRWPPRSP